MIITNRMHGQGYLLNDDRASGGGVHEADIISCPHCQALMQPRQWKAHGGWCGRCFAPICYTCAGKMDTEGCAPFVQKIEKLLEDDYRRRQFW